MEAADQQGANEEQQCSASIDYWSLWDAIEFRWHYYHECIKDLGKQ